MLFTSMLHHYFLWHYTKAFTEILHVWSNLFWFVVNFFSLPQLLKSFFSPWRRIVEERGETFNMEDLAGFILIGLISRVIGMLMRTIVILTGSILLLTLCIGIVAVYLFWLVAPVAIFGLIIYGVILIFS